ncbi:glycosyltransferase family 2 protein [Paenibacillus contaminans]|uniref:Glycosyltransferase family 2 protein n=1 Tax=Paenibacillus contaminans TaxID=450362 RepID=A0A329MSG4_9BACL|nr:glycosyltransferase [Paenibacillus contaminans]RAV22296.1 glycosyltransferase family 2 protein [Paenibacillus contaminans]
MQPLISVVIPTYNRLGELGELLESLSRQTYRNLQIIIVNDNGVSVDALCSCYRELSIRVIDMEANGKHVRARNRGVEEAEGEFILLCDDDDLLVPEHIENMHRGIEDSDLVYSDVEIVEFNWSGGVRLPVSRRTFAYEHDLEAMRRFSTFVPSGCLYRRSIHETIGFFDTEVYHYWDWDFFLRVSESFRVRRVPAAGVLYAFALGGDNLSGQLEDMRPYLDKLSRKHGLGELPTKNFFLLLEEEDVKSREAETSLLWDGTPFRYRCMNTKNSEGE